MPLARLKMAPKATAARMGVPDARDRMMHRRMVSDRRVSKRELRELIDEWPARRTEEVEA